MLLRWTWLLAETTKVEAPLASSDVAGVKGGCEAPNVAAMAQRAARMVPADHAGPSAIVDSAAPSTDRTFDVPVTNTGDRNQVIDPVVQVLGPPVASGTAHVHLDPAHDPTFVGPTGKPLAYQTATFTVPAHADHLSVRAAGTDGQQQAAIRLTLLTPDRTWAGWSSPSPPYAPYAQVEQTQPAAGVWTAVVWTTANDAGWRGAVGLDWSASRLQSSRVGHPTVIPAGATAPVRVTLRTPGQPGDADERLVLASAGGVAVIVPVALRANVAPSRGAQQFAGAFTGINGSTAPGADQIRTFVFPVAGAHKGFQVHLHLAGTPMVEAFLIDPDGHMVAGRTNCVQTATGLVLGPDLTLYQANPRPGQWRIALDLNRDREGTGVSALPFTGTVTYDTFTVDATSLPHDPHTMLPAGHPTTVAVQVTNTGAEQEKVIADPRLDRTVDVTLRPIQPASDVPIPTVDDSPAWQIPPGTTALDVAADATAPIDFDLFSFLGSPDILSTTGTHAIAHATAPELTLLEWGATADVAGPPTTAPVTATFTATAHTAAFDTSMATSTSDPWLGAIGPPPTRNELILEAGQTGTITLTITPTGAPGTVVHGTLYIDNLDCLDGTGDVVTAIPYSYQLA
jgi:hypothetical protein